MSNPPSARRYVMQSTADERKILVDECARMCADYFGSPTRPANIANWWQMPITDLRRIAENWKALTGRREEAQTPARGKLIS